MFFEPLYLTASGPGGNELPQLKRVVVVNGDTVAMEPTLPRAIDVAFGRAAPSGLDSTGASQASPTPTAEAAGTPPATEVAPTPAPSATVAPVGGDVASLVAQALDSYNRGQQALRNGDFAGYGAELERQRQILERLQQLVGTPVAGTPSPAATP
jgi:uncharacterized membrane protein (UPF0182 family)